MNAGGIAAVGATAAASLLAAPIVIAGTGILALHFILKKKSITYHAPKGNKILKEPIRKKKPEIQETPPSLVEKSDPNKYIEEKTLIRRPTKNCDFNFQQSLNLGGIADIDLQTNQGAEDYFNSSQQTSKTMNNTSTTSNMNHSNNNFPVDDTHEFQTPLEIYKSYNVI